MAKKDGNSSAGGRETCSRTRRKSRKKRAKSIYRQTKNWGKRVKKRAFKLSGKLPQREKAGQGREARSEIPG